MKKTKKKKSKVMPVMYQLSCMLFIAGLFGAGCYWAGRCDEAESPDSIAFKRGFEAGTNDCGGITCEQMAIAMGQGQKEARHAAKAARNELDRLMARLGE